MKEIKDDTNGKVSCAFGLEELILVKCPYYPKQTTYWMWLNVIIIKILITVFTELEQIIYMEPQKTPNYQSYL